MLFVLPAAPEHGPLPLGRCRCPGLPLPGAVAVARGRCRRPSTDFQPTSPRYPSALASASLAWVKTASTVSASSISPLYGLRTNAISRSLPPSPKAASQSSGRSPPAASALRSSSATSFNASA